MSHMVIPATLSSAIMVLSTLVGVGLTDRFAARGCRQASEERAAERRDADNEWLRDRRAGVYISLIGFAIERNMHAAAHIEFVERGGSLDTIPPLPSVSDQAKALAAMDEFGHENINKLAVEWDVLMTAEVTLARRLRADPSDSELLQALRLAHDEQSKALDQLASEMRNDIKTAPGIR